MHLAAALLAPFLLLITTFDVADEQAVDPGADATEFVPADRDAVTTAPDWPILTAVPMEPEPMGQVRIEQRMTIRITPRAAMPLPPDLFAALEGQTSEPHYRERKIGKCLPIAGIAGSRPSGSGSLLLMMRDRRVINAELDRTCRARDFYSGFYLAPSSDGMLCVDRDTLLSRSGTNCKLSRIRQLVERGD